MTELLLALAAVIVAGGVAAERVLVGLATRERARAEAKALGILASSYRMETIRTLKGDIDMSIFDKLTGRTRRSQIADDGHDLDLEIHTPDEGLDVLPLALRTGPAPADGTHFRTVGRQALIVRPPVELDLTTGAPTAGLTQQRIGMYLSAMVGAQLGTTTNPADVTDWTVVDHQSRLLRFRGYNRTSESVVDLVIPVQPVSEELAGVLDEFRAGSLALTQEAHKDRQDLAGGQKLIEHSLRRLHALVNDDRQHVNRAERVMLETAMLQRMQYGAHVPFAEPSGEELAPDWFRRQEEQPDGHPVIQVGDGPRVRAQVQSDDGERLHVRVQVADVDESAGEGR